VLLHLHSSNKHFVGSAAPAGSNSTMIVVVQLMKRSKFCFSCMVAATTDKHVTFDTSALH
jgi:hypothetical protein